MAERVGFEPTIQFPVYGTSNAAPSAARPPLHRACCAVHFDQKWPLFNTYSTYRLPQTSTEISSDVGSSSVWRRGWDSNPRSSCPDSGFRDRPIRPLSHLSSEPQVISSFSLSPLKNSCSNARLSSS